MFTIRSRVCPQKLRWSPAVTPATLHCSTRPKAAPCSWEPAVEQEMAQKKAYQKTHAFWWSSCASLLQWTRTAKMGCCAIKNFYEELSVLLVRRNSHSQCKIIIKKGTLGSFVTLVQGVIRCSFCGYVSWMFSILELLGGLILTMTAHSKNVVWFLMSTCIIAYKVYSLSCWVQPAHHKAGYTQTQLVTPRCWTSQLQRLCASSKSDVLGFWGASGASLALRADRNAWRSWGTKCPWERSQIAQPTRRESGQGQEGTLTAFTRDLSVDKQDLVKSHWKEDTGINVVGCISRELGCCGHGACRWFSLSEAADAVMAALPLILWLWTKQVYWSTSLQCWWISCSDFRQK